MVSIIVVAGLWTRPPLQSKLSESCSFSRKWFNQINSIHKDDFFHSVLIHVMILQWQCQITCYLVRAAEGDDPALWPVSEGRAHTLYSMSGEVGMAEYDGFEFGES